MNQTNFGIDHFDLLHSFVGVDCADRSVIGCSSYGTPVGGVRTVRYGCTCAFSRCCVLPMSCCSGVPG
jgi:hypothetical protein